MSPVGPCGPIGPRGPWGPCGPSGPGGADYARIFIFIVTIIMFIATMLLIVTVVLIAILTVVPIAIVGTSHKLILSVHKITSLVDFGKAPLQYMLFFDDRTPTIQSKRVAQNLPLDMMKPSKNAKLKSRKIYIYAPRDSKKRCDKRHEP